MKFLNLIEQHVSLARPYKRQRSVIINFAVHEYLNRLQYTMPAKAVPARRTEALHLDVS